MENRTSKALDGKDPRGIGWPRACVAKGLGAQGASERGAGGCLEAERGEKRGLPAGTKIEVEDWRIGVGVEGFEKGRR